MGSHTLLQKEGTLHTRKAKSVNYKVIHAVYVANYVLLVTFGNNEVKEIDFAPALLKYAQGYYAKYKSIAAFKKFKIENNNIVWGNNWDLIFPPENVYNNSF